MKCSNTVGSHRLLDDGAGRRALVMAISQNAALGSREALHRGFTLTKAGVRSLVLTPLGLQC